MNKTELKQLIKEELQRFLKEEAEEITADRAQREIAKRFADLVKAQDLLLKKIDDLKTKRSSALNHYKNVKLDPQRVGPAVQALKDINDEIKDYETKLTAVEKAYDQAIASSTEALDVKKTLEKSDEEEAEEKELASEFADEEVF